MSDNMLLRNFLFKNNLIVSRSEMRKLVSELAISVNGLVIEDDDAVVKVGDTVKIGRHKVVEVDKEEP